VPYSPNANWNAATASRAQQPRYYIAIDGITSYHFSTGPVRAASMPKKPYLHMPAGIGQKISQLQGRTSLNLFTLQITNRNNELNDLFANERTSPTLASLINRRVDLFAGYADLAEADYAPWPGARIRSMRCIQEGTLWEFGLTDLRRAQQETICIYADARGDEIELAFQSDAPAGVGVIRTTGDPTGWNQGDKIFFGPSTDGANPGVEELVAVQQVRDTTNEVFFDPPLIYKYKAGDPVRTGSTLLEGNPLNVLLALQTGDFANATWPLDRAVGKPTGMGIDPGDLDVAGVTKERDRCYSDWKMRFRIARPTSGSSFCESQIYRWLGYPRVRLNGKVGFRAFRPPFPDDVNAGLATLTEADIIDWEVLRDVESRVNRVVLGVDSALGGGQPAQLVTVENTSDQALTEEQAEVREETTGFAGNLSGRRLAEAAGAEFLRRFGDGPFQVKVKAPPTKRAIEAGEDLLLTHSRIPNPKSATPGVSLMRLEVVERNEDLASGRVELVVQDANWVRPMVVGAAGAGPADYNAASAAEREKSTFVGPAGDPVPNFAVDGSSPYEVA
jgi:hypothetical protein